VSDVLVSLFQAGPNDGMTRSRGQRPQGRQYLGDVVTFGKIVVAGVSGRIGVVFTHEGVLRQGVQPPLSASRRRLLNAVPQRKNALL
jgi:hypothetical protein